MKKIVKSITFAALITLPHIVVPMQQEDQAALNIRLIGACKAPQVTPQIIDGFIQQGANVNYTHAEGPTALHMAATHHNNTEITQPLIDVGARVNAVDSEFGMTPFHCAVDRNNTAIA